MLSGSFFYFSAPTTYLYSVHPKPQSEFIQRGILPDSC